MNCIRLNRVALGLAGLMAASAWAQSSVALYGLVDTGLRIDRTSSGTIHSLQSGMASGSRWGIRGTEDLGGGWKVKLVLEAGFAADSGVSLANGGPAGTYFGRTSSLAVESSGYGQVGFGRQYTPIFNVAAGLIDPLGYGMVGNLVNSIGLQGGTPARASNAIMYSSPNFSGLQAEAMWALGESTAAGVPSRSGDQWGGSVTYKSGPWAVGYARHDSRGTVDVSTQPRQRRQVAGFTYDMQVAKLHVSLASNKAANTIDRVGYSVGVSMPLTPVDRVVVQYQASNDRTAANADARALSLSYTHFLSKRTDLYASWARMDNRNSASFGLTDGSVGSLGTIAAGSNPNALQFGIRHRF